MEREGAIALLPATLFGDAQVRGPKKVHSQCRGRGLKSLHLHQKGPGQRAAGGNSPHTWSSKKGSSVFKCLDSLDSLYDRLYGRLYGRLWSPGRRGSQWLSREELVAFGGRARSHNCPAVSGACGSLEVAQKLWTRF
jgi:hypothetical protein